MSDDERGYWESVYTPDEGHLFDPADCPNADHPFKHRCALCGYQAPDEVAR